jgi:hypothetical protein
MPELCRKCASGRLSTAEFMGLRFAQNDKSNFMTGLTYDTNFRDSTGSHLIMNWKGKLLGPQGLKP